MRGVFTGCLALVAACYHPNAETGEPCSQDGSCPIGQTCNTATNTCGPPGGGGGDAPAATDAAGDGVVNAMLDANAGTSCGSDADCPSATCEYGTGTCVPVTDVLYVDTSGTDAGACTLDAPCATLDYVLTQAAGARRVIHAASGNYTQEATFGADIGGTGDAVYLIGSTVGDGAELEGGSGMTVESGANLIIENFGVDSAAVGIFVAGAATVTLGGAWLTGNTADGLRTNNAAADVSIYYSYVGWNGNFGVHFRAGTLVIDTSTIIGNSSGGLNAGPQQGTISVQNTWVVQNGGSGATTGGIQLSGSAAFSLVSFDTIADNANSGSVSGGVACGNQGGDFVIDDTIFEDNGAATTCATTYCLFDVVPPPAGSGNIAGDPMFENAGSGDYNLTSMSPARNNASPNATLDYDIYGNTRPQGPWKDIGADEVP